MDFLKALEIVEDARPGKPSDHGKGIGALCIHRPYWEDACQFNPSIRKPGYRHCTSRVYSMMVVEAYMLRYCESAWRHGDWETCARVHLGGPDGPSKKATASYGKRVMAIMETITKE